MKRVFSIWILVFVVTGFAADPAQDFHGWQAQNAPGLVLESVRQSEKGTAFSFKNVSSKGLMAYSICFTPPSLDQYTCHNSNTFLSGNVMLAPGKSKELTISTAEANGHPERIIRIAVAIYEDGTAEGSEHDISRIEMSLLGRALETYRLSNISSAIKEPTDAEINRLAVKAGPEFTEGAYFYSEFSQMRIPGLEMPDFLKLPRNLRNEFSASVESVRRDMHRSIKHMRELPTLSTDPEKPSRSEYVSGVKDRLREQSSRLIDHCKRIQGGRPK